MPHKIALNGFGRLGRLALMAQTLPLMPPGAKRVFEEAIDAAIRFALKNYCPKPKSV